MRSLIKPSFTRTFSWSAGWRIGLLILAALASYHCFFVQKQHLLAGLLAVAAVAAAGSLWRLVHDTNRRLTRFLESVRFSDFAIRFSPATGKGEDFEALNSEFNEVLGAFRQTRAEKEANLVFLNALVQNLATGVLVFDGRDSLLHSNSAAFQLLGTYRLRHLGELPPEHRPLREFVSNLKKKEKLLYHPEAGRQIAVQGHRLDLQGRQVRLLTLQNIHPELQQKELAAWRDLTRVLRHEIMNSVTPIVSVVETAREMVASDFSTNELRALADLREALDLVAARSRGLVAFVDAYRSFTSLPKPKMEEIEVEKLVHTVCQLDIDLSLPCRKRKWRKSRSKNWFTEHVNLPRRSSEQAGYRLKKRR